MNKTLIRILDESIAEYSKEADELMIKVKYSTQYGLHIEYMLDRVNECKGAVEAITKIRDKFNK